MSHNTRRGVAVCAGALAATLIVSLVMRLLGSDDTGLATTFIALCSGSFSFAIYDALPPGTGATDESSNSSAI